MWITRPSGWKQVFRSFCPRWIEPYKVVKKISDVLNKVRQPYGRKDVTLHHDKIKQYLKPNFRFTDIRTDVNQQRYLLNTKTNVNQQREILLDIFTDSEDNPKELPDPFESDSNSSTKASQALRRSQRQRFRPQYLNDYIEDLDFSLSSEGE